MGWWWIALWRDVEWAAGGGLYSSLSFLFICFRDPLSPKAHCLPSSLSCASSFQSTYSSVFWVDLLAVTLYRWLLTELCSLLQRDLNQCTEQRTSDMGISKERRDEVRFVFNPLSGPIIAHSLAWFQRTSLEGPHTPHSKIEYNLDSAVLLCDRECGWGRTSLGTLIVICAHIAFVWSLIHLLRPYKL